MPTEASTETSLPTESPTATWTSTPTPTETETPDGTSIPEDTPTPTEMVTPTETGIPTETPAITETPTPTPTVSETPVDTDTPTPSPTATETPAPTATAEPVNGSAQYVYDGDGNLVKSIIGEVVTYYPNASYELRVEGTSESEYKYYFAGSMRIALRVDEAITWLLSDHLGSTSVTVDATGNAISMLKYTAYGELRTGASATDYQYTGQRSEVEVGLYFYVSRFYDPQLARFISADTIVPEPNSIKGYDRYAYVNGNPVNYSDPSGHIYCDTADGSCTGGGGGSGNNGRDNIGGISGGNNQGGDNGNGNSIGSGGGINNDITTFPPIVSNFYSLNTKGFVNRISTVTPGLECTSLKPCIGPWVKPKWWDTNEKNPDYYMIALNFGVGLGIGASITLDRYGVVYLGFNVGVGKSITAISGGYMVGYLGAIPNHELPDSLTLTDSLSGFGINGTLGAVGAIGVNKSINSTFSKLPAYEYGGVLPVSAGVNLGYQFIVYDPNRKNK
jgi:RHS repeat-associated protein